MAQTPLWLFHGSADAIQPVRIRNLHEDVRAAGGTKVRYAEYPGLDHSTIWAAVEAEPRVMDWLLGQSQSSLSTDPSLVGDWASRLLARDPKTRATAEAALAEGGRSSFPLLSRFLAPEREDLHSATFRILQRIGPPAIPLLADLLRHESDSVRRGAVNELVDLAPIRSRFSRHSGGRSETRTGWSRAMPPAPWVPWARGPALQWAPSSTSFRTRTRTSASTRRRPWRPSVRAPRGRRAPWPTPWAIPFRAFAGRRARPSGASARLRSLPCRG